MDGSVPEGGRTSQETGQASRRKPRVEKGTARDDANQSEQVNMFKCSLCPSEYKTERGVKQHMTKSHKEVRNQQVKEDNKQKRRVEWTNRRSTS